MWSYEWKEKKKKETKNNNINKLEVGSIITAYKNNKQCKKVKAERKKIIMEKKEKRKT